MTSPHAPMLSLRQVSKRYGGRLALDGVSFVMGPGEIAALLGGNGAGKTTTLKCILGVTPFDGSVEVGGIRVERRGRDARRLIGYVPQLPALSAEETCEQSLAFTAELRGVGPAGIRDALERVHLLAERSHRVGELSGGMRQRLALAAALLGDPKVLLLDEPTASLDTPSRAQFERIIRDLRAEGRSILLSTHQHTSLEDIVDHVLILREGRLVFDGPTSQLLAPLHRRRYVVTLNGDGPSDFLRALAAAGVPEERVTRAPVPWDELVESFEEREGSAP
jgi:ABC-type multidrug transport system ATPase subunit